MEDREFYSERQEQKPAHFSCPHCRQDNDYEVAWLVR